MNDAKVARGQSFCRIFYFLFVTFRLQSEVGCIRFCFRQSTMSARVV